MEVILLSIQVSMLDLSIPTNKKVKSKALFLDRDGIINVDYGYVYKVQNFTFNDKIFDLLHLFLSHNYKLFIVTNQSGIGRGYYSIYDFNLLTEWMIKEFKKREITIEEVKFCPHAPELKCKCRKPEIGMVEELLKNYSIDLESSWLIGDKQSDIDLAHNAYIAQTIAIGNRVIKKSDHHFKTISECYYFFNQKKILLS